MKRSSILVLLVIALGFLVARCASATDLTLVADAHVNAARAASNYGSLANLYVGNGNVALLSFDLVSLPAGTTASQVSHATLTLFVNRVNATGAVVLSPVSSAWSEAGVTYASIPTIGPVTNTFTASIAGQYVTLDVTALVQAWVNNPSSNNGVALSSSSANLLLDSKENDQTAHPARLDVTLTSMGAAGATGAQGVQGPQGLTGVQGPQGLQGPQGSMGGQGTTGAQGAMGATGATGQAGAAGPTGLTGAIGATGATGVTGATGAAGVTGATGATGVTGATGATGVTGATGAAGSTVGGSYDGSAVYYAGSVVVYGGQTYLGLTTNQGILPGSDSTVWSLISGAGNAGATGATGATGPQGLPGLQGATGATGVTGVTGATGAIGYTGYTGVTGATGLNGATGATGSPGNTGVTGSTGTAGNTGATGSTGATGVVAYQGVYSSATTYALNAVVSDSSHYNSYVSLVSNNAGNSLPSSGANAYWAVLASQGAQGLAGSVGSTGATGQAGQDGATGPTGSTGATGQAGPTYPDASQQRGIPYTVTSHYSNGTTYIYNSPLISTVYASRGADTSLLIPTSCTANLTIFSTYTASYVLYTSSSSTGSQTQVGGTCATSSSQNTCTISGSVSQGAFLELDLSGIGASTNFTSSFSCQ